MKWHDEYVDHVVNTDSLICRFFVHFYRPVLTLPHTCAQESIRDL